MSWLSIGSSDFSNVCAHWLLQQAQKAAEVKAETLNHPKPYLDPEEPAFVGLVIMISLYKSLNKVGFQGLGKP